MRRSRGKTAAVLTLLVLFGVLSTVSGCRRADSGVAFPAESEPAVGTGTDGAGMDGTARGAEENAESGPAELAIRVPSMMKDEYPTVNGSTATLPLSIELYRRATGCSQAEAESRIVHSKTTESYYRLMDEADVDGGVSLVLAYEPPQAVYDYMKEIGTALDIKPIGKDALVFMVNAGNPVSSLSEKQLVDIYAGRMKNWSQAGGEKKEILAFQRPDNSGSQTLMEKLVMKEEVMEPAPSFQIVGEMGELIRKVASYNNQENAIGYSVYFYARNMYQNPALRFMEVDGVLPSNQSIKDGSYPYVNEFYAAIRKDEPENSNARILFDWLTGDDGQRLIESLGYVGLGTTKVEAGAAELEAKAAEPPEGKESGLGMAEPLLRQEERGPAAIHLKENEKILLDGHQVYGTDGVTILNGRMEREATLEDVSYPDRAGTAAPGTPVLLCDTKTGQRGLYEISRREWLLEPSYDSLFYNNETKSFWGYRWDETEEKQRTFEITVNGGKITEKEMDLSAPYYVTEDSDGDCVLLNSQGECVFSKADLDPAFLSEVKAQTAPSGFTSIQVGSISGDGAWFEGFVGYETNHFIYDLKKKKLVSRLGDKIETYLSEADSAYTLTRDGKTTIHNALGGPLKAQNGHDFEYILGRDYYGYLENGRLIVEDIKGTVHYELETENRRLQNENIGYSIARDTFFLIDEKEYSVWQKETCLMSGPMLSWWASGDYVIINAEDQKNMALREKDGELVYQSRLPEQILSINDAMLAVSRGNYFYLINFDGEYALKLLDVRMRDD